MIDFEGVFKIEDPGSISVFMDRYRMIEKNTWSLEPLTKAAEVPFPEVVANFHYTYEEEKENSLIASLSVLFDSISVGPMVIDFLGSVLSSLNLTSSEEKDSVYQSDAYSKPEERPLGPHPSFYEEEVFFATRENERISIWPIMIVVFVQLTGQIHFNPIKCVCAFDNSKLADNTLVLFMESILIITLFTRTNPFLIW